MTMLYNRNTRLGQFNNHRRRPRLRKTLLIPIIIIIVMLVFQNFKIHIPHEYVDDLQNLPNNNESQENGLVDSELRKYEGDVVNVQNLANNDSQENDLVDIEPRQYEGPDLDASDSPLLYKELLEIANEKTFKGMGINEAIAIPSPHRKATLVIMSYSPERKEQVTMILWFYSQMNGVLEKIIFVWNNIDVAPPDVSNWQNNSQHHVNIELWQATENLITNRHKASSELASPDSPILLVDDDVFLSPSLIHIMLQHWRDDEKCQQKCIVGLDPRFANIKTKRYDYSPKDGRANLAIGKTILVHQKYLGLFIKDKTVENRASSPGSGCDDISFSLFQTNYTGVIPRFLAGEIHGAPESGRGWKYYSKLNPDLMGVRYDLPELDGLSVVASQNSQHDWTSKRNDCVRWNLDYFGKNLYSTLDQYNCHKIIETLTHWSIRSVFLVSVVLLVRSTPRRC